MRILIAEDDLISRNILQAVLLKFGHEVVAVNDGRQALEALGKPDAPRLAILDWMMPEMDGVEVCRGIRQAGGGDPAYLILLTARDDEKSIVEGLDAGANDYLTKPYRNDELRARVGVGQRMLELQDSLSVKIGELGQALEQIRTLRGIIPICASCKKIRDDKGFWNQVEAYVQTHSEAEFSHSICPECVRTLYPEFSDEQGNISEEENIHDK
jgi:phosphoserine phosphatase RsbU/P